MKTSVWVKHSLNFVEAILSETWLKFFGNFCRLISGLKKIFFKNSYQVQLLGKLIIRKFEFRGPRYGYISHGEVGEEERDSVKTHYYSGLGRI